MTLAQRTDYSFSLVIWLGGIRKILVPAKSRFIAISIAAGVLRPIAILVTIFPPVAMIAVVILTTRIRIEPLILVHVFASLAHSVLISSSVADIGAIAIASVIAPVVYAFVPIGVPDLPRPGSRFGNLHGSRYRNHDDRHSDTPPRIPSIADIRGWPAAVWFSKIVRVVFTPFVPTSVVTIAKTLLIAVLSRLAIVGLVVAIIVVMILSVREAAECYDHGKC